MSDVCSFVPVHSCGRSNHDSGLRNGVNTSLSLTGWTLVRLARPTERPSLSLDISECFDLQRFHFVQFTDYLFTHSVFIPRLYLNSSFFHVFVFCDTKFGFYLSTKVLWVFPLGYRFGGETSRLFVFFLPPALKQISPVVLDGSRLVGMLFAFTHMKLASTGVTLSSLHKQKHSSVLFFPLPHIFFPSRPPWVVGRGNAVWT